MVLKRHQIAVGVAVLLAMGGVGMWGLSKRSACQVARAASGLPVPCRAQVVEFHDEPSGFLDQDLDTRAELTLSPADFAALFAEAQHRGFRAVDGSVPSTRPCVDQANQFGVDATGICLAAAEIAGGSGLYRYVRNTPSSYTFVVLDSARRRLVARFLIL
jgi:hypothetical protein